MKKLYFLNEDESNRILNLHRNMIKKQSINEAGPYQDLEGTPGTTTSTPAAAPTTPTSPAAPTTPSSPATPTTPASPTTPAAPTAPKGNLTQQLQALIGVTADGKFGPKSLQGLKDKLKTTTSTTQTTTTPQQQGTQAPLNAQNAPTNTNTTTTDSSVEVIDASTVDK